MSLNEIYDVLFKTYSSQGWWPITGFEGVNPTKTGSVKGYHPGDYSFPRNNSEKFEIMVGAILTQNTSWPSVEKAVINIKKLMELTPENILTLDEYELKSAIRPAGYFNQKYDYLQNMSEFYINLEGNTPERNELLSVKGIGDETADSILLYAYHQKEFVIDAYTKRIFSNLNYFKLSTGYIKAKRFFEENFQGDVYEYQEYHALLVEHGKRYYSKKPYGFDDDILDKFIQR